VCQNSLVSETSRLYHEAHLLLPFRSHILISYYSQTAYTVKLGHKGVKNVSLIIVLLIN
jgi:hypothetical protein